MHSERENSNDRKNLITTLDPYSANYTLSTRSAQCDAALFFRNMEMHSPFIPWDNNGHIKPGRPKPVKPLPNFWSETGRNNFYGKWNGSR